MTKIGVLKFKIKLKFFSNFFTIKLKKFFFIRKEKKNFINKKIYLLKLSNYFYLKLFNIIKCNQSKVITYEKIKL